MGFSLVKMQMQKEHIFLYKGLGVLTGAHNQEKIPFIFEDGLQTRDFIHVQDIVHANLFVLEKEEANNRVFNVGTGVPTSIKHVVNTIAKELEKSPEYNMDLKWRLGDVRHIYADISYLKALGFVPKISFEEGIKEYIKWFKIMTQRG